MILLARSVAAGAVALVLAAGLQAPRPTRHDKAFWQAIVRNNFAVPAGASISDLVTELTGYLASPDPELRDDIAYSTLTSWIYRQKLLTVEQRRALMAEWLRNLTKGIGEQNTDSVFGRSFSTLSLGILAISDNETPYLEKAEFDRLLTSALGYLHDEQDTRGFDPAKGWIHTVAHTADLLKFLARNRHLEPAQQGRMLRAIADKMSAVDGVLTHGEDERLARAALSIAARPDFDQSAFQTWIASLAPARTTAPPTPVTLAAAQNRKNLLVSLYAVLSTDARNLVTIQSARDMVLAVMKGIM